MADVKPEGGGDSHVKRTVVLVVHFRDKKKRGLVTLRMVHSGSFCNTFWDIEPKKSMPVSVLL